MENYKTNKCHKSVTLMRFEKMMMMMMKKKKYKTNKCHNRVTFMRFMEEDDNDDDGEI